MNLGKPMRYIEGWSVLLFVIVIGGLEAGVARHLR